MTQQVSSYPNISTPEERIVVLDADGVVVDSRERIGINTYAYIFEQIRQATAFTLEFDSAFASYLNKHLFGSTPNYNRIFNQAVVEKHIGKGLANYLQNIFRSATDFFRSQDLGSLQLRNEALTPLDVIRYYRRDPNKTYANTPMYDGRRTILEKRNKQGIKVFIITSNSKKNIERRIKSQNIAHLIHGVYGKGNGIETKTELFNLFLLEKNISPNIVPFVTDDFTDYPPYDEVPLNRYDLIHFTQGFENWPSFLENFINYVGGTRLDGQSIKDHDYIKHTIQNKTIYKAVTPEDVYSWVQKIYFN